MTALRKSFAAVGTAILLASCASGEAPMTSSSVESSRAPSGTPSPNAATPLDGTWQSTPISPRDVEATLRRKGLAKWLEPFGPVMPFSARTTLILELHDGEWDLYGRSNGASRQEIDYDAEYVVDGDAVRKIHATGGTTYRWSVDGDTLALEWLDSTEPEFEGIPDEVFSTALYMTSDFTRQR